MSIKPQVCGKSGEIWRFPYKIHMWTIYIFLTNQTHSDSDRSYNVLLFALTRFIKHWLALRFYVETYKQKLPKTVFTGFAENPKMFEMSQYKFNTTSSKQLSVSVKISSSYLFIFQRNEPLKSVRAEPGRFITDVDQLVKKHFMFHTPFLKNQKRLRYCVVEKSVYDSGKKISAARSLRVACKYEKI